MQWLAELGGVFYSIKEKGYSQREKRVTEFEFNRKMEIETKMQEDKEREARRLAKEEELIGRPGAKKAAGPVVKKMTTHGAVRKPVVKRRGIGF